MREFYLDIARRMGVAMKTATYGIEALVGVVLFAVGIFAPELSSLIGAWEGIHRAWALLPIGLVFGHLFLKAIYEKYRDLEVEKGNLCDARKKDGESQEQQIKILAGQYGGIISQLQDKVGILEQELSDLKSPLAMLMFVSMGGHITRELYDNRLDLVVYLRFENLTNRPLAYTMNKLNISSAAFRENHTKGPYRQTIVHPNRNCEFNSSTIVLLAEPLNLIDITIEYDIVYDTIPPTGLRRTARGIKWKPVLNEEYGLGYARYSFVGEEIEEFVK